MFDQPVKRSRSGLTAYPARTIIVSFLVVILVGGILLMLPISSREGAFTPLADAMFTATSATCVTGLVVYDTYLYWSPFGQTVILVLIQVGGLGLVTFATFFNLALGRKMGLRGMDVAKESLSSDSFADVRALVRTIFGITFGVEAVGAALLALAFIPRYGFPQGAVKGIFISISAFCNAGFDLMGSEGAYSSLMSFADSPLVLLTVSALVITGGLGFVVWRDVARWHRTRHLELHTKVVLVMSAVLLLGGMAAFLAAEWNNPATLGGMPFVQKLLGGFFQSVTVRTAGFNAIDQAAMTDLSKIFAIALMFIGAAPAGTGGGIKVTTVAVIVMTVACVMRGENDTVIFGRRVEHKAVYKALALFLLALCLVVLSAMVIYFALDRQAGSIDIVYEEVSAFATVGLSAGITGQLSGASRLVLILSMFLGRVGPISLAVSLSMRGPGRREVIPAGKILIG